jgi:anti-anti-sigma regulatory factor
VPCRIEVRRDDDRVVVHLAGRLSEAEVPDLLQACATSRKPPSLELDELVSADAVGIDALLRMRQKGARLVGLPEYLRLKLDTLARERQ